MDLVHGSWTSVGVAGPRWHGQRARWRTHRSLASGLCGARKLAGGGATMRGERGEPGGRLTEAQAAVWRPGDGEEIAMGREVGNRGARASGEGESELGRCGEVQGWRSLFIGARGEGGRAPGGPAGPDNRTEAGWQRGLTGRTRETEAGWRREPTG
jgi:hypothetical protein